MSAWQSQSEPEWARVSQREREPEWAKESQIESERANCINGALEDVCVHQKNQKNETVLLQNIKIQKMSFTCCEPKNEKFAWRADPAVYPTLVTWLQKGSFSEENFYHDANHLSIVCVTCRWQSWGKAWRQWGESRSTRPQQRGTFCSTIRQPATDLGLTGFNKIIFESFSGVLLVPQRSWCSWWWMPMCRSGKYWSLLWSEFLSRWLLSFR